MDFGGGSKPNRDNMMIVYCFLEVIALFFALDSLSLLSRSFPPLLFSVSEALSCDV